MDPVIRTLAAAGMRITRARGRGEKMCKFEREREKKQGRETRVARGSRESGTEERK